jgi:hypothetical protein
VEVGRHPAECDTDACCDLVASDECVEEPPGVRAALLGDGQEDGDQLAGRMSDGVGVAVLALQHGDRRGIEHDGIACPGVVPGPDHGAGAVAVCDRAAW